MDKKNVTLACTVHVAAIDTKIFEDGAIEPIMLASKGGMGGWVVALAVDTARVLSSADFLSARHLIG